MAAVLVNGGKVYKLQGWKNDQSNQRFFVYQNNVTPSPTTVLTDLTEADFAGYGAIVPVWGGITVDGTNTANMTAATVTFTCAGGGTTNMVYGWGLKQILSGGVLLVAELLPGGPKSMANAGDSISITFTLSDTQG